MTRPFSPRVRPDLWAALAVSLAPLLYFMPAVRGEIVLCEHDNLIFNVPLRVAAANVALDGSLPLWNPYIFSGMPLFAAAQGGLLFPLNWFYLALSAPAATNAMVISSYAVAGLGAYLYARRNGASTAGALLTAMVWQWGGFLVAQISHVNIVHTGAMLPWVLWAVDGYAETGESRRRGLLLAALVALQAFAGHQQTFAFSLLLVGAYAFAMAFMRGGQRRAPYLRSLLYVAAGIALAAVQILPTFELLRNSLRSEASYEFLTSFSLPRRFLLTPLAPYLMGGGDGRLFRAPYVGPPFYAEYVIYVGLLALALALTAVLLKRDARTLFWAAAALVCLLLALGDNAFGLYKLIQYVPVLNLFRVPARHVMEVQFALAVLAGRGLTALASSRGERRALRVAAIGGAVVLLLTCIAVTAGRPPDFRLGREAPVSFLRAPEFFVPVLLAALSAWALWAFARGRWRRVAYVFLFAVLALDLAVWGHSTGWRVASPKPDGEYFGVPETVKQLRALERQNASPYRILTAPHPFDPDVPPVGPLRSRSTDWVLWTQPDVYMMHGIENAAGYDGFGLARYSRLAGDMTVWGELPDPDSTLRGAGRELDVLNVRYLLSMRRRAADGSEPQASADAYDAKDPFPPATNEYGGFGFAENELGLPSLRGGRLLSFSVPPVEAEHIALLTNLSWSESVPDGATVGRVRLVGTDGRAFKFELRAGADTSEWAYDRKEIRARVRHKRARVATSHRVEDAQENYEGHTYVTSFALPERMTITGGDIALERPAGADDLLLSVLRVTLAGGGRSYPLRREWFSEDADASRPSAGTGGARWRRVARTDSVDIHENLRALPRAWLASSARVLSEAQLMETIRTGRLPDGQAWEPLGTALVESPIELASAAQGDPAARADIVKREANRIEVNTSAGAPSVLVLSENHYPGWRAYVDGRAVETLRVNYNQRGVELRPGRHRVEFVYRPKSVLLGAIVSLLTALGLVTWWRFGYRRRQGAKT